MTADSEPYLVAHKCRGALVFDIAVKTGMVLSDGEVWIMPTTGHRVRPFWAVKLSSLFLKGIVRDGYETLMEAVPEVPEGHPDHYAVNDRPFQQTKKKITNLDFLDLKELGL